MCGVRNIYKSVSLRKMLLNQEEGQQEQLVPALDLLIPGETRKFSFLHHPQRAAKVHVYI